MSFHVYMKVVESDLSPSTSRVAEVYALFANEQNNYAGSCSADWLAWRTKQSESSVRVAIRELRAMGFLETLGVDPKYQTKIYRVHPEVLAARAPYSAPETYGRPKKGGVAVTPPFDADEKGGVNNQQIPQKGGVTVTPKKDTESSEKKEEESISFRNSTELEKLSSVAQPESVSPIPSKSGLDVVERDQHRALHNVAQAEPVIAQDFATLIAESLPDTPEPVTVKSKPRKATSAKSALPPKPKREPKPPRELDQREVEFLAQVTKLDPFMGKQVESRLRKYRRDKPWSAIQVFLLTGKAVPPASLQAVTSLNGTAFDTELMLKCLSAWVSKGWSPTNLAWLLEWYKAGGPPQYTPKYGTPDAYVPPPKPQALEWEDSPIGKEAIARMAKQKAEKEQEMKGQEYATQA